VCNKFFHTCLQIDEFVLTETNDQQMKIVCRRELQHQHFNMCITLNYEPMFSIDILILDDALSTGSNFLIISTIRACKQKNSVLQHLKVGALFLENCFSTWLFCRFRLH
jgi:hypothetical protein